MGWNSSTGTDGSKCAFVFDLRLLVFGLHLMTVAFLSLSSLRQFYFSYRKNCSGKCLRGCGNWGRRNFTVFLGPGGLHV